MTNLPSFTREEHIAALIESVSAYIEQYHCGLVELVGNQRPPCRVGLPAPSTSSSQRLRSWRKKQGKIN
jgi:hypothetical protein